MGKWLQSFQKSSNRFQNYVICQKTLDFVKWFVTANLSGTDIKNVFFQKILAEYLNVPSYYILINTLLPAIVLSLKSKIEEKLLDSFSICLITDIWTNRLNKDYIALAAVVTDSFAEKSILVLGMARMPGPHNAENIKYAIEQICNEYGKFDKSKIHGKFRKYIAKLIILPIVFRLLNFYCKT